MYKCNDVHGASSAPKSPIRFGNTSPKVVWLSLQTFPDLLAVAWLVAL